MNRIEHVMGERTEKIYICVMFCDHLSISRIRHIEKANESNAIELLMVTDELFRFVDCAFHASICAHLYPPDQQMFQLDRDMWH